VEACRNDRGAIQGASSSLPADALTQVAEEPRPLPGSFVFAASATCLSGAPGSVAVTAELVAIFVFKADLHTSMRPIFVEVSRAAVHIFIIALHLRVSTSGAMVHVVHHSPHVLLTHAIHHTILIALLSSPVSIYASVFGALTVSLACLI
jgi:hypothetical protein